MKRTITALVLCMMIGVASLTGAQPTAAIPPTYYVDGSVATSGDGASWDTAWKTITEATETDLSPGSRVLIKPGVYHESIAITSSGADIIPVTPGIRIAYGNHIIFPDNTDLSTIDVAAKPGQYYIYVYRSWVSNNGVYPIVEVLPDSHTVVVDATLTDETSTDGDVYHLSAAVGQPIIYQKAPDASDDERVVLDASTDNTIYTVLYIGHYIDPYHANPANYNIVDGLDLTGSHNGGGVHIQNSSHNVIRHSRIYDQSGGGVLINGHDTIAAQYNIIQGNTIYNTPNEGVYIGAGSKGEAQNDTHFNHIIDNDLSTQGTSNKAHMENAIDLKEYNQGNVVEGNVLHDFTLFSVGNGAIDVRNEAHHSLIYGNLFRDITGSNRDTEYLFNIYPDTTNVAFFNNVIYNTTTQHDGVYAINVHANNTEQVVLYHNTIHQIDKGLLLQYSTRNGTGADNGVTIANNSWSDIGTTSIEEWTWDGAASTTFDMQHNCYSVDPQSDYGGDAPCVGDMQFVDANTGNFHIGSDSVARDAGTITTPAIVRDSVLAPRNDGTPDVGAFEYQPTSSTATPTPSSTTTATVTATSTPTNTPTVTVTVTPTATATQHMLYLPLVKVY